MGPGDEIAAAGVLDIYGELCIINPATSAGRAYIAITRKMAPAQSGSPKPSERPEWEGRIAVGDVETLRIKVGSIIKAETAVYDVIGIDPAPGGGLQIIKLMRR